MNKREEELALLKEAEPVAERLELLERRSARTEEDFADANRTLFWLIPLGALTLFYLGAYYLPDLFAELFSRSGSGFSGFPAMGEADSINAVTRNIIGALLALLFLFLTIRGIIRRRKRIRAQIKEQRSQCCEDSKEVLQRIPTEFVTTKAVKYMESALNSGRADNLKEAMSLYQTAAHQKKLENERVRARKAAEKAEQEARMQRKTEQQKIVDLEKKIAELEKESKSLANQLAEEKRKKK